MFRRKKRINTPPGWLGMVREGLDATLSPSHLLRLSYVYKIICNAYLRPSMPAYLIHGFRWQRKAIRIFVILQDIEDASPDWIIANPIAFSNAFYTAFEFLPAVDSTPETSTSSPSTPRFTNSKPYSGPTTTATNGREKERPIGFNDWSLVKLLEQYDSEDLKSTSQPYAYVGDYVLPIDLSCDIGKEMEAYEQRKTEEMLALSVAASDLNTPTSMGPESGSRSPATVTGTSAEPTTDAVANLEDTEAGIRKMSSRDFRRRKKRIGWLEKLRDQLQKEAEIGWYVVICEDEERRLDDGLISSGKGATREGNVGDRESNSEMPTSASALGSVKKFWRRRSEKSLRSCGINSKAK